MYNVEMKDLTGPSASKWERIESGWESPNTFAFEEDASVCARTLALRHDGDRAFRVVDQEGFPTVTFAVVKHLQISHRDPDRPRTLEEIPPGFEIPMLRDVLPERSA